MTARPRRKTAVLAALAVLAVLALFLAPFAGMTFLPFSTAFEDPNASTAAGIFWRLRVPRVCVAFLAGSGLALGGMVFQAMFRNPLATPFTLGVASGASLGAATCIALGLGFSVLGVSGTSVFALLGAGAAIALVYGLTRARRGFSTGTMLLAGVAVSFFFSSLILLIQYLSEQTHSLRVLRWLMGGLDVTGPGAIFNVLPFVAAGSAVIFLLTHELNLLTTGEDLAASRGVSVTATKLILFLVTSLTVGGVVAVCGPVGFVGMMVPHICRMLIGSDHRYLAPATFLFGGVFLIACDGLARTLLAPAEMPVGIVTALLGGPFFLWLLVRRGPRWAS